MRNKIRKRLKEFTRYLKRKRELNRMRYKNERATEIYDCKKKSLLYKKKRL